MEDLILPSLSIDTPTNNYRALWSVDNTSKNGIGTSRMSFSGIVKGHMSSCLRLSNVDNSHGEEADIVLITIVRSNLKKDFEFMKTSSRATVMLTRAWLGTYIISNVETI